MTSTPSLDYTYSLGIWEDNPSFTMKGQVFAFSFATYDYYMPWQNNHIITIISI